MENREDDALELGAKSWNRVIESAVKTGYREGIDIGSEQVLQSDFDKGYIDGFRISFILGKYKALTKHLLNSPKNPQEIDEILEATRRGECYICKLESSGDLNSFESSKIIEDHRGHVFKILGKLNDYFSPLLAKENVEIEDLSIQKFSS